MSEQNGIELVSAALVAVQGELKAAEFDSVNPFFKSEYASLKAVIEASRAALLKHGLAVQQIPTIGSDGKLSVETVLRHSSGQFLQGGVLSLEIDGGGKSKAQSAGAIITYFRRYAWSANLGIYADEDTDGNTPPTAKNAGRADKAQPAKTSPESSQTPSVAPETKVSAQYRMKALHNLKGAVGEPNRQLVTDYLRSLGFIAPDQQPEEWPLMCVPKTKEQMEKLVEEVQAFEMQVRQEDLAAETEVTP